MDSQEEMVAATQEGQISALTQRVAAAEQRIAALEQRADHMRDIVERLADHSGFSHPGFGDGH
jgi:predicted  nucleic acid-binding Zn-ribbon protein